jgi:regulatory protein
VKITSLSVQVRNKNRINVSVDGKYRFSLEVAQIADLGLRIGKEYSEDELVSLEQESLYGKLYAQALEYALIRPRSAREMKDYFYKKNRSRMVRSAKTGEVYQKEGISQQITDRVFERLVKRGYVNDESFAKFWVENRQTTKGISQRKLTSELFAKGISQSIIDNVLKTSERNDQSELEKIITKKASRYDDPQKLMAYLARLGFSYDDIKTALNHQDEEF